MKKYLPFLILSFLPLVTSFGQIIDYTHFNKGIELKNLGNYNEAINAFGKFIQQYPYKYSEAYYQRAKTYLLLHQFEPAISDLKQVITLDEVHKKAPYALGKTFFQLKEYPKALEYLTKAIQLNPNDALYYNDRGLTKCYLRNYDEALKDFQKAVSIDPTFALAYNNAGTARYFKQDIAKPTAKDLREAKDWFSKAIKKDPTLALAYRNRGAMHLLTGHPQTALVDFEKAFELTPHDPMVIFFTGVAYADLSKTQKAFDSFRKALEMNPKLSFAHEEKGNLYKRTKQYESAIREYQNAQLVWASSTSMYQGLQDYRIALVYAELQNAPLMYKFLKKAKEQGAFSDQQLYRNFQKAKEFKPFRTEKSFRKFQKSLAKIRKENKFLNPELGWFRMERKRNQKLQ